MYGPAADCEQASEQVIREYEGVLPAELLQHWREAGWCSYGKGLLWIVDPGQFEGVLQNWLDFESGRPLVFLRTAFAHLYLWHDGYVYSLDVQRGSLSRVTKDIKRIFALLVDPEIQERILRVNLYQQALARLGPPNRDECYAFEPALALGGTGTVETLRRVQIREHLAILAQVIRGQS